MGWLVHARLGAGVLQRTSWVCPHHTSPRASDRPRRLPQRLQSPLRAIEARLCPSGAQAGAKRDGMNEDHQHKCKVPCLFARKGACYKKGCERQRNEAERARLQIAAHLQPGQEGGGRARLENT